MDKATKPVAEPTTFGFGSDSPEVSGGCLCQPKAERAGLANGSNGVALVSQNLAGASASEECDRGSGISVRGVRKTFESKGRKLAALERVDLEIEPGEFVCLLGPSGCGKSTLLNAIAGFSLPTEGTIIANGKEVRGPGPDRAMVFQEYALFPWMTVERNVAFGLEMKGVARAIVRSRAAELLKKLSLYEFRDRFPKDLSGGMRQRVAIARALAIDSPMLLMDEPFGALDALTRRNLQDELLRIWSELRKTVVFVTHGIREALYLADRVVVMTFRPGTVKRIVYVDLPRPRDPGSLQFNELEKAVSQLVMEEQLRHEAAERNR